MKNPEIRFKDDNIDWISTHFKDIYIKASEGGTPSTTVDAFYRDGTIPFVKIEDTEQKYIEQIKNFINELGLKNSSAWLVPENSLIFTNGATVGNVSINKIPIATKQGILSIILKENFDLEFLYYILSSEKFQKEVNMRKTKGTFETIILKYLDEIKIKFPTLPIQQKIASLLSDIDQKISSQESLIQKLKDTKSALLIKMFPQENQSIPEIRFAGFSYPWEQRKLGETVNFYSGLTYSPNNVIEKDGTLVLRSSNIQNGEIALNDNVYVENKVVNSLNVSKGDIVVVVRNGSRALIGKHAQIKEKMDNTVIGAFMTGINSNFPSYINALLSTSKFNKEIEKNLGATINQITTSAFKEMNFAISTNSDEKNKIGTFFASLDHLLVLHQRKLDKLKEVKSALLDKLLV